MRSSSRRLRPRSWVAVVALVAMLPAAVMAKPAPPASKQEAPKRRTLLKTIDSSDVDVWLEVQARGAAERDEQGGAEADDADPKDGDNRGSDAPADETAAVVPLPLEDGRWERICEPPCKGHLLPRDALYRITGDKVATSSDFSLPPKRSKVTLEVESGDSRLYWTGAIAAIAGATFLVGSLGPRLVVGGKFSLTEKVLAGTGTLFVGVGVPLWWFNRTTVAIF